MIGLGLRQVQDALNRKADDVQHEFVALSERMEEISKHIMEVRGEDRQQLRSEQESLRAKQSQLAEEINTWRDRARGVMQQRGETALRNYLEELKTLGDTMVTFAIDHALYAMDNPEEARAALEAGQSSGPMTPAARLLQRARTEYDMRGSEIAPRQRAAVEFANRTGMAQDDLPLEELTKAMEDHDPVVREVATLAVIQLLRFRAMRLADLDKSHEAVQGLIHLDHPSVVQALIEVMTHPRTGFVQGPEGPIEAGNERSRMAALLRLVEWHTAEVQVALRNMRFDRDPHIVKAAEKALTVFPGEWKGSLKEQ
ncbi:MAG TPA: hypothetical protein VFI11_07830 [Anaerolineales bacterium]|nr:hypothetical protein [Anaerolineales bacterium]